MEPSEGSGGGGFEPLRNCGFRTNFTGGSNGVGRVLDSISELGTVCHVCGIGGYAGISGGLSGTSSTMPSICDGVKSDNSSFAWMISSV